MSVSVSSSLPPTEVFLQPQGPRGGGLFPQLPETCVLPGPGAARVAFGPEIGQTGKLVQPLSPWFSLSLVFSLRFPPLLFSAGTCSLAYLRTQRFGARAVDTSGGLGGFQVVPQSFLYKEPCLYERRVISMAEDPCPASRGADPGPLGGRRSSPGRAVSGAFQEEAGAPPAAGKIMAPALYRGDLGRAVVHADRPGILFLQVKEI
ncbi:PREDICTED: uncharacterized protein LOC105599655 isoform X2 [Cercocebus atys]|uniref:uncharacterized protein LOC105599655 isoform X2 n=1 Tax=Cercocebus atys TaxID=9531 RepID=UPI0005F3A824|nr:PREDICTED: uncharacterized protein LOC105599655 isoform X2 [Cercocebus atys]